MKVRCGDVRSFTENLKAVEPDLIFERTVWVDMVRVSINEAVENVCFQASAVVGTRDGGEFLLQLGMECGRDYNDSSGESKGTTEAERIRKELTMFCEMHGLVVKPGIVSE